MDTSAIFDVLRHILDQHLPQTLDGLSGAHESVKRSCETAVRSTLSAERKRERLDEARAATSATLQACEARLLEQGWDSPSWQEALIFAHICAAAQAAEASSSSEAMRHVDMAIMRGCPEHISRAMVDAIEPCAKQELSFDQSLHECELQNRMVPQPSSRPIRRLQSDSVTPKQFKADFWKTSTPVVLEGEAVEWPAHRLWRVLGWWAQRYGHRTVPLEIGTFAGGDWREQSATIADFCAHFLAPSAQADQERDAGEAGSLGGGSDVTPAREVAYLAQHRLFEQLPALLEDVRHPRCWPGPWEVLNVWMGTIGTVTPLHYDSMDNFLCQVAGSKYVRLYAWNQTPFLYVDQVKHGRAFSRAQGNISAVDVESPDLEQFPLFAEAVYTDTILNPGDALYIPAKCWHFVRALSTSISVNFWF